MTAEKTEETRENAGLFGRGRRSSIAGGALRRRWGNDVSSKGSVGLYARFANQRDGLRVGVRRRRGRTRAERQRRHIDAIDGWLGRGRSVDLPTGANLRKIREVFPGCW